MPTDPIRFDDGAAYERYMGVWSQSVGAKFLDWLSPKPGLRWLDIGCGNGAFTEMLCDRCKPVAVMGVDPSEAQINFARNRLTSRSAEFKIGDAMALPFADHTCDAAVMPLVIFFVPDPHKGVAEMARVVAAGGIVSAYAWDLPGGGFPYAAMRDELDKMNVATPWVPSPDASNLDNLRQYWTAAGLKDVETTVITVERTFPSFDDYWTTIISGPSVGGKIKAMSIDDRAILKARLQRRLSTDAVGRVTYSARANAVKGRVANN